ncbi:MAG: hypothetical protein ACK53I_09620, partial [Phenylobacterium sp.]
RSWAEWPTPVRQMRTWALDGDIIAADVRMDELNALSPQIPYLSDSRDGLEVLRAALAHL